MMCQQPYLLLDGFMRLINHLIFKRLKIGGGALLRNHGEYYKVILKCFRSTQTLISHALSFLKILRLKHLKHLLILKKHLRVEEGTLHLKESLKIMLIRQEESFRENFIGGIPHSNLHTRYAIISLNLSYPNIFRTCDTYF